MNNVFDYIKIGLIAFVFIWLADRALKAAGMNQFTISG